MPQFAPSSAHKATVTFSNPKTAGFDYSASLCMGVAWTVMASASFHLNAGESKAVQFSVTMPATPGTYPVYFEVTCGGVLIGTFAVAEAVVIAAPAFSFGVPVVTIVADIGASAYRTVNFSCVVKNNTSQAITRTLNAWMRIFSIPAGVWLPETDQEVYAYVPYVAGGPGRIQVTLSPGQSYTYSFQGNWQDDQGQWFAWLVIPLNGRLGLRLRDDLGNQSQEVVVS